MTFQLNNFCKSFAFWTNLLVISRLVFLCRPTIARAKVVFFLPVKVPKNTKNRSKLSKIEHYITKLI